MNNTFFTDPKYVFFAKSYSDVQMIWKLERTSRTKLSTMQKKWNFLNFSSICFHFVLQRGCRWAWTQKSIVAFVVSLMDNMFLYYFQYINGTGSSARTTPLHWATYWWLRCLLSLPPPLLLPWVQTDGQTQRTSELINMAHHPGQMPNAVDRIWMRSQVTAPVSPTTSTYFTSIGKSDRDGQVQAPVVYLTSSNN
jgi:hypothetical protein